MITTFITTSGSTFAFSKFVEKISRALKFLAPANIGPWMYK